VFEFGKHADALPQSIDFINNAIDIIENYIIVNVLTNLPCLRPFLILNSLKLSLIVFRFRFHSQANSVNIKPRPELDTCSLRQLHWTKET